MPSRHKVIRHNNDLHNSAYIKTWPGYLVPQTSYESAGLPRGAGWGTITNILFSNFNLQGPDGGPAITQDNGDNGSYPGTSKMLVSNVAFVNFTGYTSGHSQDVASVSCSSVQPCYGIEFEGFDVAIGENGTVGDAGKCEYTAEGGVHGLSGGGC